MLLVAVPYLVPSQWLLVTGTAPLDGGAPGVGVERQRFTFQANLYVRPARIRSRHNPE